MKAVRVLAVAVCFGVFAFGQEARATTIYDNYIGANPGLNGTTSSTWYGKDVIGKSSLFGVEKMNVAFANGRMQVDIFSDFFDNITNNGFGVGLGDLFISTDGYHPHSPTMDDNALNGETWEYVLALDSHDGLGGNVELHALPAGGAGILMSDDFFGQSGYIYRQGQEVQYDKSQDPANPVLATGQWSVDMDNLLLSLSIDMLNEWSNVKEFGFHWTMTCGNDVIEGAAPAPVPEPTTIFLFGTGLVGLASFSRKKAAH